ncbi:unnamed protein product [Sphenostylis stenocarpa]|uniref:Uncharacterized protein n=1 Tax=Sphenostylis stenocarpa TaxID=92480 RepID=A0AA86SFI0_9FABA|nr:unnamed protein product [Sphenostylis stenocarpa]
MLVAVAGAWWSWINGGVWCYGEFGSSEEPLSMCYDVWRLTLGNVCGPRSFSKSHGLGFIFGPEMVQIETTRDGSISSFSLPPEGEELQQIWIHISHVLRKTNKIHT